MDSFASSTSLHNGLIVNVAAIVDPVAAAAAAVDVRQEAAAATLLTSNEALSILDVAHRLQANSSGSGTPKEQELRQTIVGALCIYGIRTKSHLYVFSCSPCLWATKSVNHCRICRRPFVGYAAAMANDCRSSSVRASARAAWYVHRVEYNMVDLTRLALISTRNFNDPNIHRDSCMRFACKSGTSCARQRCARFATCTTSSPTPFRTQSTNIIDSTELSSFS